MVTIRKALERDIPDILTLYGPFVENTAISFEYEVPSLEDFTLRFRKITNQFPWLVCEIDGVLAGYAYASVAFERTAYQWDADISVYINEKYHRQGMATAFYHCIEQFLSMQGYYHLYALITGNNENSLRFHQALGYTKIGVFRHSGYKLGAWHHVIWYEKNLRECIGEPQPPRAFSLLDEHAVQSIVESVIIDTSKKF